MQGRPQGRWVDEMWKVCGLYEGAQNRDDINANFDKGFVQFVVFVKIG